MYKRFDLYLGFKKKHIENTCRYLFFLLEKKLSTRYQAHIK
jgi:hypothetical protein